MGPKSHVSIFAPWRQCAPLPERGVRRVRASTRRVLRDPAMKQTIAPADRRTDLAHDVLRQERQPLEFLFAPKNVAVIGATETANSVGRTVLWNLVSNPFGGTVYPVNLKRP